jgi:nitrate reductase alpha subunit
MKITRREFLKMSLTSLVGLMISKPLLASLKFIPEIDNPLDYYPDRDWERIYRSQYGYDYTFHFLCAPNDTHNCLLRAYVKNGIITRIGPSYGYGKAKDIYGNQASSRWEPRLCNKGLVLNRRVYGPRRVKYPMIREGFKRWIEAGFPRGEDGRPPDEYFQRGKEGFVRVSWDEIFDFTAKPLINIATTYSGQKGMERLRRQGYDPATIQATKGAGTQVLKFRGGMPLLGISRVFGMYRLANSMALLDSHIRGIVQDKALGARGWDNYSWHTDLPPGHPMVTGQQTVEFDLVDAENARLIIPWGMNWISTKMPDAHWLTEARAKGTKVISVTVEYSSVVSKSDEAIIIRPGTDAALALGLDYVIMKEKLYDEEYITSSTDLPFLVRMDSLKLLRPEEIIPDFRPPTQRRDTEIIKKGEVPPPPIKAAGRQYIPEELLKEWGNFVMWDKNKKSPVPVTRDEVGKYFKERNISPVLEGEFEVKIKGKRVKARTVYSLVAQYIKDNFDPETVSKITWAPKEATINLARQIAANKGRTLIAVGMGPNHFFNNDLKDRAIFLLCALTKNVGTHGGNIGSYAGNYRAAYFDGMAQFIKEDPFNIELDEKKEAKVKGYFKFESAHYFNHGDRPLRVGNKLFTGNSHLPTPTKSLMFCNANSILGNLKGHYDVVINVLPKIELIAVSEWWWTASCEYADIVFPVDSWAEFKHPDATASVTNPFLQIFPPTPLKRLHDTIGDIEVFAGVSASLAKILNDDRFYDYWKFVHEGKVNVYLQRILDHTSMTKGYKVEELEADAREGIPALLMSRTYPKIMGWEQAFENKKWYTKTGRLEFYREENEFIEYGENLPVYREPVDGTVYEPNVIVARFHPAIKPYSPEKYGISVNNLSTEIRQIRNIIKSPEELLKSVHPLKKHGYTHLYITPKYRHSAHSMPVDVDIIALWFGPFGDPYRKDKRMPWVSEGYVDINPQDAKVLGIEDGDYVWLDADPEDRPYRGEKMKGSEEYRLARLMLRARYYYGVPPTVSRSWFHMHCATFGSVKGHLENPDGLARNPKTSYQAMYRFGSHQSCTRGWLKPTLMTESLVRKDAIGQVIKKGFSPDVHCPTGAPKESFVKFTKAEDGGIEGNKLWRPARLGLRPTYENQAMRKFLEGGFIL